MGYTACMPPGREELLQRIYELERDNNRMLHAMRRNSFIGGIFRVLMWIAALGIPIWLYMQYLAPVLNQAIDTMNKAQESMEKVQGIGAQLPTIPVDQLQKATSLFETLKQYIPDTRQP